MTKDQLIDKLAEKVGVSKRETGDVIETMIDIITLTLQKGEKVVFTGFGAFQVSKRAARRGINPKTGEKIQIPAMTVPKFKAGRALKEAVK